MSSECARADVFQGRNQTAMHVVTRNREYFTWETAFLGLTSEALPDRMRARFCDLLIGSQLQLRVAFVSCSQFEICICWCCE